jgi:hypothetical protein
MSQSVPLLQLAPDDRAMARALWDALLFAPSLALLEVARQQLKAAPHSVQEAVMNALVPLWANNIEPQKENNPFSCGS